jgi:hypothetical protein
MSRNHGPDSDSDGGKNDRVSKAHEPSSIDESFRSYQSKLDARLGIVFVIGADPRPIVPTTLFERMLLAIGTAVA